MTVKIMLLGVALFRKEADERLDKPEGEKLVIRFPGDPGRVNHYDEYKVTHHHPWLYATPTGNGKPLRVPLAGTHVSIEGSNGVSLDPDSFSSLIPMGQVMQKPELIQDASIPSVKGPCLTMINLYEGKLQGGEKLPLTFPASVTNPKSPTSVNGVWRTHWESFSSEVVVRIWTDANPIPAEIPLKATDWSEIYLVNADKLTPENSVKKVQCTDPTVVDNDFRWIYHLLSPGLPGSAEQAWKAHLKKAGLKSLPCPEYQCPPAPTPRELGAARVNPEVGTCLQGSLDG